MNRAMSQPPGLIPDSFNEIAPLAHQHFFCGVIRLPEFVAERFHKVDALPRQNYGRVFYQTHGHKGGPPRMRAKADRCLFQISHCENLSRRRALHNFPHNFPRPLFIRRGNVNSRLLAGIFQMDWNFVFLHRGG